MQIAEKMFICLNKLYLTYLYKLQPLIKIIYYVLGHIIIFFKIILITFLKHFISHLCKNSYTQALEVHIGLVLKMKIGK